jgi:hypothetical protein
MSMMALNSKTFPSNPLPKTNRKTYHTAILLLYASNREYLLPETFRDAIPDSNKSDWRNLSTDKFTGHEHVADLFEQGVLQKELYLKYRNLKKVHHAATRIYVSISDDLELFKHGFYRIQETRRKIVQAIESVRAVLPFEKLLKLFKISASTYHTWLGEVRFNCEDSPLKRCRRWYSNQLTRTEVKILEKMLRCKEFMYWPVYSIAQYAARQGILCACPQTWHKYKRELGIYRKKIIKSKYAIGIRAKEPDKIWHSDFTLYRTEDKILNFIYIVIDNFSRKVLAWLVTQKKDMRYQKQVVKMAYDQAIKRNPDLKVDLIVDGGSEHHNVVVNHFLAGLQGQINQLTALKDIAYSNSMVEAFHKLHKYQYLFPFDKVLLNPEKLIQHMNYSIPDYNDVRPHYALKGLTPSEAHDKKPFINFTPMMEAAAFKRKAENKNSANHCGLCKDLSK